MGQRRSKKTKRGEKEMSNKSKIILNFSSNKKAEEFLNYLIKKGCLTGKVKDYKVKEAKKK